MANGYCPECGKELKLGRSPRKGQRITCIRCGALLQVAHLSPIELDWAYDEELEDNTEEGQDSYDLEEWYQEE